MRQIPRSEITASGTCPEDQGQIVERSWLCCETGPILVSHDRSDGEETATLYEWDEEARFEPQNGIIDYTGEGEPVEIVEE